MTPQKQSPVRLPPWAEPSLHPLPLLCLWVTHPPAVPCPGFVPHHPPPLRQCWPPASPCSPPPPPLLGFALAWSYLGIGQREKELTNTHVARASEGSRCEHRLLPPCRVLQAWTGMKQAVLGVNSLRAWGARTPSRSQRLRGFMQRLQQLPGGHPNLLELFW